MAWRPGMVSEVLNRQQGKSYLFNMRGSDDALFNQQRLNIMILQVAIIGIIVLGVTQIIMIRGLKDRGVPLIHIGQNLRQLFDLGGRIVVFRPSCIVANLRKGERDHNDRIWYITGAMGGAESAA